MTGHPEPVHRPRIVKIEETRNETPTVRTLMFTDEKCSKADPGQFIMIWNPGVDEIPMSLSYLTAKGYCGVTVRSLGEATQALHASKVGDKLGVRGPYGQGFKIADGGRVLVVGGGTGIACLAPLVERLSTRVDELSIVLGAKTRSELLFIERIKKATAKAKTRLLASTDDGSYGSKGLASDIATKLIDNMEFDVAYTCGPEQMMKRIADKCLEKAIPLQASLERLMKCGIGICGSCVIGEYRVCKDGPVFDAAILKRIPEFGVYRRDASGAKIRI
jgi:dihydroorotate dehydrogenase electron transfer subunit